jgi:hypothetical protein
VFVESEALSAPCLADAIMAAQCLMVGKTGGLMYKPQHVWHASKQTA